MATRDDVESTKTHERYPSTGPLKSIKISLAGYWARFEKSPDGKKVVLRGKGEMLNSRAFNVSIPHDVYSKMHKRAICEFKPAKQETMPKALPAPASVQFVDPQPIPVPVVAIR